MRPYFILVALVSACASTSTEKTSQPPRSGPAPSTCNKSAAVLYEAYTTPPNGDLQRRTNHVRIYASGYWERRDPRPTTGCLTRHQLETLMEQLPMYSVVVIEHPKPSTCPSRATNRQFLSANGRSISWLSPCGGKPPHPAVPQLLRYANGLTTIPGA